MIDGFAGSDGSCRSFSFLIFPFLMALSLGAKRVINWAIKSLHRVYGLGCTTLKKDLY